MRSVPFEVNRHIAFERGMMDEGGVGFERPYSGGIEGSRFPQTVPRRTWEVSSWVRTKKQGRNG